MVDDTEKTGTLSLAERAASGKLAQQDELRVDEIPWLEHPSDPAARKAFNAALWTAIKYGDLARIERQREKPPACAPRQSKSSFIRPSPDWRGFGGYREAPKRDSETVTEHFVNRETYRAWRALCPPDLLSPIPITQIHKWLGATPAIPLPEPFPDTQAAIAAMPLSLAERAKRGLLVLEDELLLDEILELACGDDADERKRLLDAIRRRIKHGGIADPRLEVTDDGYLPGCEYIKRESFRAFWVRYFPTLDQVKKEKSQIDLWLDATPAIPLPESILPVSQAAISAATSEPLLPSSKPTRTKKISSRESLELFLTEIEKRAKAADVEFDRHCMPGTKEEFQQLAIAFNRRFFSKAPSTFSDYLDGVCQFEHGVKPQQGKGAVIWNLFPAYKLKLG